LVELTPFVSSGGDVDLTFLAADLPIGGDYALETLPIPQPAKTFAMAGGCGGEVC
jgi:hypothetical protein